MTWPDIITKNNDSITKSETLQIKSGEPMKNLFIGLVVFATISAFAQDVKIFTCQGIYESSMKQDIAKAERYNKNFNRVGAVTVGGSPDTLNSGLTIMGALAGAMGGAAIGLGAPVTIPLFFVGALTPQVVSIVVNSPNREERALELLNESTKRLNRFTKRMQRQISRDITNEDIIKLTQNGFDNGFFCSELPKLMSPAEIRKYVKNKLSDQFGSAN